MKTWTLITGASEGLGAEFARIAATEARNLILTARSEDKLAALADELRAKAGEILVLPADLSDLAQVETLWHEASRDRHIDVLVNNAGLGRHGAFGSGEGWARDLSTISVNMTALSYLMKMAIPHMQAQGGGRILNVTSAAAFMPGPNMSVYHATKAYVLSLSEAVAEELRGSPVSVTALCPGATQTAFFDAAGMRGIGLLKLGRPARADAVARAGWQAMMQRRRLRVTGAMNKLFAVSPRLTPRALTTFVAGKVMGKWGK
ncbi:SDR family oxidoreductase [uncultured Roseovarius sp.]|uniref:SDR family NAD(P)-dependent oxidoreductase n=1 Tax=uncultured Roseovarius sp. TaxID=293344 RepID=UPI00260EF332|nr:SDR family oxidoreductase [uncultured Roseovarius sp.]